ncbi:MAG: adenylate cyclase [Acidimicrobiales bacterium]
MKGVDSVELKITVPETDHRSAIHALSMDPLDAEIRQVFFFDTTGLDLFDAGVIARARRTRQGDDSVVKLRPVVPAELPKEVRKSPALVVEVDAMPGTSVCSASLKADHDPGVVKDFRNGRRPLKKVFTREQRGFFEANAPGGLTFRDLAVMGPLIVFKLTFAPSGYDRDMVAEMWMYPDGSRALELSTKCRPAKADAVAAETKAFLVARGVDVDGFQETKTAKALRFFAAELAARSGQSS